MPVEIFLVVISSRINYTFHFVTGTDKVSHYLITRVGSSTNNRCGGRVTVEVYNAVCLNITLMPCMLSQCLTAVNIQCVSNV